MAAKLPVVIDNLVEVIGPLRDFYSARRDGKWELTLDGDPPDGPKLAEFRDNNRKLNARVTEADAKVAALEAQLATFKDIDPSVVAAEHTELAELKAKFEGIDPDEYRALKAKPDTTPRITELEAALVTEKAATAAAQQAAADALFESRVGVEFLNVGGDPKAMPFALAEAKKIFSVENGQLTTKSFSTKKPGEPLGVTEWLGGQLTEHPFLFKPSKGGGAGGNARPLINNTISNDPVTIGQNLEAIAKGDLIVRP